MEQVITKTTLVTHTCLTCGIQYAFPLAYEEELRRNHKGFYCPVGHEAYFPAETEQERLRRLWQQERRTRKEYQEENVKLNSQLKRINAGVCPYCRRHFANVERHIRSRHKDKL